MKEMREYLLTLRMAVAEAKAARAYSSMEGSHMFESLQAAQTRDIGAANLTYVGEDHYPVFYEGLVAQKQEDKAARR